MFTKVRWFELNKQQQAQTDLVHTRFVEDNYYGEPLHLSRIKDHIGLIKPRHLEDIEWAEAPALVSTNSRQLTAGALKSHLSNQLPCT